LPPFGLQRNRKTLERTTIGKPLYFCSAEFVGQFLRGGALPIECFASIWVEQMNKAVFTVALGSSRQLDFRSSDLDIVIKPYC
jgi:hypothetical protein